jgi:hypothetical protein
VLYSTRHPSDERTVATGEAGCACNTSLRPASCMLAGGRASGLPFQRRESGPRFRWKPAIGMPASFRRLGQFANLTLACLTDVIQTDFPSQKKLHSARKSSWGWSPIWTRHERPSSFQAAVRCRTASTSLRRPVSMSNTKPLTGTSFAIQGCDLTCLICSRVFCSGSL